MMEHFAKYIPKIFCLDGEMIRENICLPVIIKPNISICGAGMTICQNNSQLRQCQKNKIDIMQKFILNSHECAAHMFCINGQIINCKITRQKYNMFSIKSSLYRHSKCEYIDDFDITIFSDIMKHLNYSGGCCIDFKMQGDVIKIFEINPRFGGSVFALQLFEELIKF
jgi:carbamoylphosphate synthase large subunit